MSKTINDVLTVGCGSDILVFGVVWRGDRFYEEIARGTGASLTSIDSDESFESPVYTECHYQDGRFFLSGASRDRHWSLSVECLGDEALIFDAACRAKSRATVASMYEPFKSGVEISSNGREDTPTIVERNPAAILVRPSAAPGSYPATLRWRYEIRAS